MRSAEISKLKAGKWKVVFIRASHPVDYSWGFETFEAAAEAAKNWILNEEIG